MVSSKEIRSAFLNYFAQKGHEIVPSSPLVPANDPTLLFTNAGMVQFKDVFLGAERRPYMRATTTQRCVRAGGKHNDLDNVGYTARHHTFFEMLGNFSFGDYFKREAIRYCWDLLTNVYQLPEERLWVTVFEEDQEAEKIWFEDIGIDRKRFSRCGAKDNFWAMGDTGPCGPCSEVFYDHGAEIPGGPPGSAEEDGDRYVEIWNLVFMQYDRLPDGELKPLPKPSVDTGMGLERLAAILQGKHNNYDTDLFMGLTDAICAIAGTKNTSHASVRVIADHIRSCSFMVVDGVVPGNEGRGSVLRRIIRRALRHGHKLGLRDPFFYRLVTPLVEVMGEAHKEIALRQDMVEKVLYQEEVRFSETLDHGMQLLNNEIANLSGSSLSGDIVFKLYDTFGFPADLTADVAREHGLTVDAAAFEKAMDEQRKRARSSSQFKVQEQDGVKLDEQSVFTGYRPQAQESVVKAILVDGRLQDSLDPEEKGGVVFDKTPFYGESGGQIGDTGRWYGNGLEFIIADTQHAGDSILHLGTATQGAIKVGDVLIGEIDLLRRRDIMRNHSATHLLHAALRLILGDHVQQKGSLVANNKLRFDFSHFSTVTKEELQAIESQVNQWILTNDKVKTKSMRLKNARKSGAMALFGEKYSDPVRVLKMGEYSIELCGGTHVKRTGDIGLFKILQEGAVAAGIRRIEAITGNNALNWVQQIDARDDQISALLKSDRDSIVDKVSTLLETNKNMNKRLERLNQRLAATHGMDLVAQAKEVDGVKVLATRLDDTNVKDLRNVVDQLKQKLGQSIIVLATVSNNKVVLVAGVSKELSNRLKAGNVVNFVAEQVGGRGGGRPEFAQAGGDNPENLDNALSSVATWISEQLSSK